MVWVTARSSFDHNGAKRRGDEFEVSDAYARQLERRRLVTIGGESPKSDVGELSSVSPVGQASQPPTLPLSETGAMVTQAPPLPPVAPPPLPPSLKPTKPPRKPKPKA